MPWFGNSSPFDADVEKATAETNIGEDWTKIIEICDKVGTTANGPKDCLRAIVKRMHHVVPNVALQALTLLDACVNNCGKVFHLEVCSRDFESEIRKIITGKQTHAKVAEKMRQLVKKWAENEFKNDHQLSLIPSLYNKLKQEGVDFNFQDVPKKSQPPLSKDPNVVSTQQEEDDIAKAIELSLKEKPQSPKSSSLYPVAKPPSPGPSSKEKRKVRALYDFEADEDNELTFKAGEVIHILDDSDPNWWKGSNQRGDGLFPANFVTSDLSVEPEQTKILERKSVQFNENVQVKTVHVEPKDVEIDEEKIDKLLQILHEADPTDEHQESEDMLILEEQCAAMGPLIDQELEKIDKKNATLSNLSHEFMQALGMYHALMRDFPAPYAYVTPPKQSIPYPFAPGPSEMGMHHPVPNQVMNGPMPQRPFTHMPPNVRYQLPPIQEPPPGAVPMQRHTGSPPNQSPSIPSNPVPGPSTVMGPAMPTGQVPNLQYNRIPVTMDAMYGPPPAPPPENVMQYPMVPNMYATNESRRDIRTQQLL